MPIRPENRDRYPADWDQLTVQLKTDAGWRCECDGRCGRPGQHLADDGRCPRRHGELGVGADGCRTVILTTAHLNHVPEDNRRENLMVLCQGCHLHYDREHHRHSRFVATRCAMEQAGQLAFSEPPAPHTASTLQPRA